MKIILLGAPGCGKGTQSKFLEQEYNIPQISTGDILRNITLKKTQLGIKIQEYMNKGTLIPDHIIINLIKNRINHIDCKNGYILDGFPRTIIQAQEMENKNIVIKYIIEFIIEKKNIYERILGRRIHPSSGRIYHVKFHPPKNPNRDDITNEKLITRSDDNIEIINNRLQEYKRIRDNILLFYKNKIKNKFIKYYQINANQNIQKIQKIIKNFFYKQ